MLPEPPPDVEACLNSVTCVLGSSLTAVVPALVLVIVALHLLGVEPPKITIFTQFITDDDVAAVEAEEAAANIKPKAAPAPDADIPTERSSLLPNSGAPITRPDSWRQVTFTVLAVLETAGWTAVVVNRARHSDGLLAFVTAIVALVSWVYAALRPSIRPSRTPYYDLFTIYFSHFLAACVALYEASTSTTGSIGFSTERVGQVLNSLLTFVGLVVIVNMPLTIAGEPEINEDGLHPALEDNCTLWQWMTFTWVSPIISLGASRPLEEKDVWQLSKSMRTRVLMRKFLQVKRASLLRRILVANAMDLFLDASLTVISTLMNFSAPFFLNLILRAVREDLSVPTNSASFSTVSITENLRFYAAISLDSIFLPTLIRTSGSGDVSANTTGSPRTLQRSDAYFFAIAAFVCQLIKSQSDLQHLYFSRRASVRVKGELVASVYEKALKRKDVTGTVQKNQEKDVKGKGKEAKPEAPQDSSSADVGKIVSLIAADSERVSRFVSMGPFIYDAPLSIIIACTMLYNLMGWTAFVGYLTMLIALPINTIIVRQTSSFQRSVSAMRDRRMRAMNEAIQSIKFIKFSAWESRWINRVLDARNEELKWLRKLKVSIFFLGMTWDVVPIMISAISFSCFTLVAKKELTVDIAFPCITVFSMLSQSLTVLPMIANWYVMCTVALKRIEKYLAEEEVPEYVSSLMRNPRPPHEPVDTRIGCASATFRWPVAPTDDANKKKDKSRFFAKIGSAWGALTGFIGRVFVLLKLRKKPEETPQEDEPEDEPEKPFELKDINVIFPEGVISLVSGPTGSGKSSLLAALLGEMDCVKGEVYLPKEPTRLNEKTGFPTTISYCAQQPWLEHKSIKDNILFGSPYDKERYEATLNCCALLPDLAIFEDGDETEIGEKGVSLSGGQKARVALARAVYARTQVVLMDDVLSAVDSHTAELIVKRCFLGPLMKHRTVILVTHHVDLVLPAVSWVVKLSEGQVEAQGTTAQLRESGELSAIREGQKEIELTEEVVADDGSKDQVGEPKDPNKTARKLVDEEKKSTGSVKLVVYQTYLSSASYWLFGLLILFMLMDELSKLVEKFWIKRWGESYSTEGTPVHMASGWLDWNLPPASRNVVPYLLIYIGIDAWISFINIISQIPSIMSTLRASRQLYEKMLRSVMRSPSRFFDKTPSGRILNRFSKDVDTIDGGLQDFMIRVISQTIALSVAVSTIVYAVPFFIVPAFVIAYIHLWFARGYINASRDLRRIEANTRSPIVSSFSELVVGIVTVRAFGSEKSFLNSMYKRLDRTQAATHYYWMCNRWLLFRFDSLGALSVLIATAGTLVGGASAGLAGIVIVQAQAYVRGLYWGLRFWTELEQSLNSVERVQEYLDLPSEPPAIIESSRPPAAWPSATKGTLVFEDLELKYSPELEPVLRGVSFETKPAERIGIVGRTGSGKSTLALSLFRFVDPAAGKIILDGIDIATIGLEDLRSRLTLIPQDAVLFTGTIRENLDPFNEYTDAECIEALQRVHLRTTDSPGRSVATSRAVSIKDGVTTPMITGIVQPEDATHEVDQKAVTMPEQEASTGDSVTLAPASAAPSTPGAGSGRTVFTLETKVSEGGNNFSQGQRQLLSMARALLRKSSVIIMDESTASVDFETDAKIQTTIREEFNQSILLTIAHRLRTIIDNDRILVLNAGRVVEFDTPANLLKKPDGIFHEMCKKSGDYDELIQMAEAKAHANVS
ncbi:multidrug resistance-associated ABC transporter [Rhizoctonia solani 123E]|uniref:Multidrug resistance-associated ABC transporter n=1 Tax=Rhizoctonia solani 123E TaxID=1423351 RepID=A0A074RYH4_9AGAM|nr:multidrug resistance-associated ABC transporter [Rhizoctonia solani 123E]